MTAPGERGGGGGPTMASATRRAPRGAADRVTRSHSQTRATLRLVLSFVVAALVAATLTGSTWPSLHLFLAGAVVLAISGVSVMLTVTWSAAPAPPDAWVVMQRWCVAGGAAGVTIGRSVAGVPTAVVAVAGAAYLVGLLLLGVLLVRTVRRGVERRFDVVVAAYLTALVAGAVAAALGLSMVVGGVSPSVRAAHLAVNLLGLVGFTVSGTLPFFAGTVVRSRVSTRATPRRLALLLCWQVAALGVVVAAALLGVSGAQVVGLVCYALGIVGVTAFLPTPTRRQLRWAGPRMIALWAGCGWWVAAVAMAAGRAASDDIAISGTVVVLLALPAYGQILWGSLAYLLPMLRGGGHERLGEGFATTRSWTGLVAVNAAGVALAASRPIAAAATVAVWAGDATWRAARVGIDPHRRPSGG